MTKEYIKPKEFTDFLQKNPKVKEMMKDIQVAKQDDGQESALARFNAAATWVPSREVSGLRAFGVYLSVLMFSIPLGIAPYGIVTALVASFIDMYCQTKIPSKKTVVFNTVKKLAHEYNTNPTIRRNVKSGFFTDEMRKRI